MQREIESLRKALKESEAAKAEAERRAEAEEAAEVEYTEALVKANERADLLQEELEEVSRAKAEAEARNMPAAELSFAEAAFTDHGAALAKENEMLKAALVDAELREIFRMADQDHSGFVDDDELLALGQAVNPSFTPQKCRDLIDRMDTSRDGKVSPDEFVELVQKVMEGLSEPAKQKGMRAMRAAAEGLVKKAEVELKQLEAALAAAKSAADEYKAAADQAQKALEELAVAPTAVPSAALKEHELLKAELTGLKVKLYATEIMEGKR